jgi:uncharacterized protein (DUF488 family)
VPARVFTIGHSTRSLDDLVTLLRENGVAAVADVRRFPRSRRHPHFDDEALARSLPEHGIAYVPMKSLGGRRRPAKGSPNTGWRVGGFQAYADFMLTPAFEEALAALEAEAEVRPTAIMCAEAVPWRCHRRLIADALVVRGHEVVDIVGPGSAKPHALTDFARVEGTRITYPGG